MGFLVGAGWWWAGGVCGGCASGDGDRHPRRCPCDRVVGASAGDEPGSAVAYEVKRSSGRRVAAGAVQLDGHDADVTGLTNGTTYTFHVRAINPRGEDSAWSQPSNPVTPQAGPPWPPAGKPYVCPARQRDRALLGQLQLGQLGDGTSDDSLTPVTVTGITTATSRRRRPDHILRRPGRRDRALLGLRRVGQLGDGTNTTPGTLPVTVTGISTATSVAAGGSHTVRGLADGTLRAGATTASGSSATASPRTLPRLP